MQPDPDDPKVALGLDMLAPEGYGEIIGGSQRIHDHDLLLQRIEEHKLPREAFEWYLDVRTLRHVPARRLRHGRRAHRGLDVRRCRTCARRSRTRGCCTRSIRELGRPATHPAA